MSPLELDFFFVLILNTHKISMFSILNRKKNKNKKTSSETGLYFAEQLDRPVSKLEMELVHTCILPSHAFSDNGSRRNPERFLN